MTMIGHRSIRTEKLGMNLSLPTDGVQASSLMAPALLDAVLSANIGFAERYDDAVPYDLFDVEERAVVRAVGIRRREFTTGRWCARQAMAKLGLPRMAIPVGHRGAPEWPAGVVGARTHCRDYRAAVVGRTNEVLTIGMDAEYDHTLPDGGVGGLVSVVVDDGSQRGLR